MADKVQDITMQNLTGNDSLLEISDDLEMYETNETGACHSTPTSHEDDALKAAFGFWLEGEQK